MNQRSTQEIVPALTEWYAANARVLPWRTHPSPYATLLSEFMCQQTRVDTAVPYFERFMKRWPTVDALAEASEEEVLHSWAGLGYYRRARNLLACAKACADLGGVPSTVAQLMKLPGVGPYTTGAVASIAFDEAVPAIDGNVERVISRLFGIDGDPKRGSAAAIRTAVQGLLDDRKGGSAGALNQALMELGATVCTPRNARCDSCPVQNTCAARASNRVGELPQRPVRRPPRAMSGAGALLCIAGGTLLARRPVDTLLPGLWEPPWVERSRSDSPKRALQALFRDSFDMDVQVGQSLGTLVHVFSHRRLSCEVFAVSTSAKEPPKARLFYTDARITGSPDDFALSTLARRVLALGEKAP